jgi:hypothetical protein
MAEEIKQITQISDDTKQGIKRKTAEMLPDNPTAAGMKAADIKAAFFKGLTDGNLSLVAELERVINEANETFSAEAKTRSDADSNLTTELGAEIAARELADTQIKATAVGVPTYDPRTGVLTFKTLDGEETVYDLPIEKIIESVSLSKDGQKFIFKFHNSADIEVDVARLTNPAWESELKDSNIPPTSAAVKTAVDGKVDKLTPSATTYSRPYVYTVNKDGEHSLVKTNIGHESNTIVIRDEDGLFSVKTPTTSMHPVPKKYFDTKTNNSLYYDHNALERRVANIEYGSSGKLYDTVELNGSGSALQVDNACPYGVLTRLSGNVARIKVGVLFDLNANDAYNYTPTSVNSFYCTNAKSVYIKCVIPTGTVVKINCDGVNGSTVKRFALSSERKGDSMDEAIGNKGYFYPDTVVTTTQDNNYIYVERDGNEFENLRVTISNYETADIYGDVDELVISEDITSLTGYGEAGSYLDLTERKFYRADGSSKDVSEYLPAECDVISLLPGSIIKFTDADGNPVTAGYSLSYKNKINT